MSNDAKTTNVEEVLPNDEDLGKRNCRWRELVGKFEDSTEANPSDQSMDIDMAMVMLDQEMTNESTVSDIVEASSSEESAEEDPEEIKLQLQKAVPLRQRQWEANGLKEILDDNEFRMLSQEKVENWLRNHMHTITGNYNVHYQTQQVTTVTETRMDADADSLYSVDTAQYIRSNKQISNKLKVTTMIKRYSVTSSVRRLTTLGIGLDEQQKQDAQVARLSLPAPRTRSQTKEMYDALKNEGMLRYNPPQKISPEQPPKNQRNRRKVFKKTIPRKRPGASCSADRSFQHSSPGNQQQRQQPFDRDQMYAKALAECARLKKNKPAYRRKVSKRFANRMQNASSTTSSSDTDSDDVFFAPVSASSRLKQPAATPQTNKPQSPSTPSILKTPEKNVSPSKTSPTERAILEPFQSITLSASKRAKPAGPVCAKPGRSGPAKKRVGIQRDGCYHEEGLIIYRPKTIRPNCPATERINLRVHDLTLTGVTKQRHLDKFQDFNYNIHPNSTVSFYPSDSSDSSEENGAAGGSASKGKLNGTANDTSLDDDDPILTFRPRDTNMLNVVEIVHRRKVT
uniref:Uncharacterized protein n=1 Tax=Anopheles epiroticus TaxID=199890 RepID=A0A182P3G5_9DIPT